jgi:hypothetical protein
MTTYKIYKITDSLSDYIYLGYTSLTLTDTLNLHITNANKGKESELYSYMRRIGTENFKIELVEEFDYITSSKKFEEVKNKYDQDLLLDNKVIIKSKPKVEEVKKKSIELKHKVENVKKKGIYIQIGWL